MKKDRSRWEIILDILKVTQEENKAKKTRIMQRTYLDFRSFQRYFDFLLEENFIAKCDPNRGNYELTESGKELLRRLKEVDEMLREVVLCMLGREESETCNSTPEVPRKGGITSSPLDIEKTVWEEMKTLAFMD